MNTTLRSFPITSTCLSSAVFAKKFAHGPGIWKFNTSLLQDLDYQHLVTSFWSFWRTMCDHPDFSSLLDWWDQGKYYLREVSRCYSKAKAVQERHRKTVLTRQMHTLQHLFERGDPSAFTQLVDVQQQLRAQVRARSQWAEEGEMSSAFFCGLETTRYSNKTMLSIHHPETGKVHHDPFAILGVWREYYEHLFTAQECDFAAQDDMLGKLTRRLSQAERESCEGHLTLDECLSALQGMARGKTPGSDGFSMEFYLAFWPSLGADLVQVLNLAFESGQLSTSQRRGLIIVLHKKNDRLDTKNWRPISLLNVDYKITTRAISARLLTVLGSIIEPDQTCGVRGRTISENLFLIRDLLEYVERDDRPLALFSRPRKSFQSGGLGLSPPYSYKI